MSIIFSTLLATAAIFGHHTVPASVHESPAQIQVCAYVDAAGNKQLYTATYC